MKKKGLVSTIKDGYGRGVVEWRCRDVLRIEAFSDAVFAFSITLLIVSLEVPRTFNQLMTAMQGFFPFAICFAVLFKIWYTQFIYFRRYGLQHFYPTILNAILIFVVLFYMYPLKFIFNMFIPGGDEKSATFTSQQISELFVVYGLGFMAVHFIFILLYLNAIRNKDMIKLNDKEVFVTYSDTYRHALLLAVSSISVLTALVIDSGDALIAGYIYILIIPGVILLTVMRGKEFRKKFHTEDTEVFQTRNSL